MTGRSCVQEENTVRKMATWHIGQSSSRDSVKCDVFVVHISAQYVHILCFVRICLQRVFEWCPSKGIFKCIMCEFLLYYNIPLPRIHIEVVLIAGSFGFLNPNLGFLFL